MPETVLIPEACSDTDFEELKTYIQQFELDDRELKQTEFLVLKKKERLVGFGRIREFPTHSELCSLGILPDQRSTGMGKLLCEALIKKAKRSVFLVCIIPNYFKQFGFREIDTYPLEIKEKLNYCTATLVVPENYVAMSLKQNT